MKKQIIKFYFIAIAVMIAAITYAQDSVVNLPNFEKTETEMNDKNEIKKTLEKYIKGGDENDVKTLEKVTHENFRVVLNDKKETAIKIVDRATYMDLIDKKVFGGTPREIEVR